VIKKIFGLSYKVEGESVETGEKYECFLHQNHIAAAVEIKKKDRKRPKDFLEDNDKSLEPGETLQCNIKIKEFNYFDNVPVASTLEGINQSTVLSWETVTGGITVEGTIREIVEDSYIVVDINDKIFGRVYKFHLTDTPQKHIPKKLKNSVGKKMTFKTWKVENGEEILELTKKESIIKEKVFVPRDMDDPMVKNGVKLTGVMVAQDEKGYIVQYFNDLRGFLPFKSLENKNMKFSFKKGALIDAYLLFKTKDGLSLTVSEEESINFKPKGGKESTSLTKSKVFIPKEIKFSQGDKVTGVVCKFDRS
jgi:hypothetical protein